MGSPVVIPMKLVVTPKRVLLWILFSPVLIPFRLIGWRVIGDIHNIPKVLAIGAPHTSNWDFVLLFPMICFYCRRPKTFIKDQFSKGIVGVLGRMIGAIYINRRDSHNIVEKAIDEFKTRKEFVLAITPEGTRKRAEYWKSGFYHIAVGANVPIGIAIIDYQRRQVGFKTIFIPTGDVDTDMAFIANELKDVQGKFPENVGPVRLKPHESSKSIDRHDESSNNME